MTELTTHVLDTAGGRPVPGLAVSLDAQGHAGAWERIGTAVTDADGRAREFGEIGPGIHRLVFATGDYLAAAGSPAFFPEVTVTFRVGREAHLHVPLLLSPYGYSTYRGS